MIFIPTSYSRIHISQTIFRLHQHDLRANCMCVCVCPVRIYSDDTLAHTLPEAQLNSFIIVNR